MEVKKKKSEAQAAYFSYLYLSGLFSTYLAHESVDANKHGDQLVELGGTGVGISRDLVDRLLVVADYHVVSAGVVRATDYLGLFFSTHNIINNIINYNQPIVEFKFKMM